MNQLIKAIAHIRAQSASLMVIKIGGACLGRKRWMKSIAQQIAAVQALGARVIVVHGGGQQIDALQASLGEPARKVDGRRITTPLALKALRMTLAGELNADLAAAICQAGGRAMGVHASGAGLVLASRRDSLPTSEGQVDFGAVGDIQSIDVGPLMALLEQGVLPVLCPPAIDAAGNFLNVNADLLAAELAIAAGAERLLLLSEVAGILQGQGELQSIVSTLDMKQLKSLENSGDLRGGMLVKSVAIQRAIEGGVGQVHVLSGTDPEALLVELYTNQGAGTLIRKQASPLPSLADAMPC